MSSLARLPVFTLGVQQLLNVGGVVQPQLHPVQTVIKSGHTKVYCLPDERFPALDTEHVPGLGFAQQLRHGALAESQYVFSEQLETTRQSVLSTAQEKIQIFCRQLE